MLVELRLVEQRYMAPRVEARIVELRRQHPGWYSSCTSGGVDTSDRQRRMINQPRPSARPCSGWSRKRTISSSEPRSPT